MVWFQARGLLQLGLLVLQSLFGCLVRLRNSTGILLFQKMQFQRPYKNVTNRESRDISSWYNITCLNASIFLYFNFSIFLVYNLPSLNFRLSKSASPSDVQLYVGGVPFTLNIVRNCSEILKFHLFLLFFFPRLIQYAVTIFHVI